MNSQSNEPGQLARSLRQRSHDMDGRTLDVDTVTRTARRIRTRRRVVTGVATGAVLVLAVPVAMGLSGGPGRTSGPVVGPTASASPTPTPTLSRAPAPLPTTTGSPEETLSKAPVTALDVTDLAEGPAPAVDYLSGKRLVRADGTTLDLGRRYDQVTPFDDGWLALSFDTGAAVAHRLAGDGTELDFWDTGYGFAVDRTGKNVVYLSGDGTLLLHVNEPSGGRGGMVDQALQSGLPQETTPIAITDAGAVLYNAGGTSPRGRVIRDGRDVRSDLVSFSGASASGWSAGMVSSGDTGSCSEVVTSRGSSSVRTCTYRFGRFSPDGRHILATGAYGDGAADTQLAVIDAYDSAVTVHYAGTGMSAPGIYDFVWEDDDHVLAVVYADELWRIIRLGLDGTVEAAGDPVAADDLSRPFFFLTQP